MSIDDIVKETVDCVFDYCAKERVVPIAPADDNDTISISKEDYYRMLEENAQMKLRLERLELERMEK